MYSPWGVSWTEARAQLRLSLELVSYDGQQQQQINCQVVPPAYRLQAEAESAHDNIDLFKYQSETVGARDLTSLSTIQMFPPKPRQLWWIFTSPLPPPPHTLPCTAGVVPALSTVSPCTSMYGVPTLVERLEVTGLVFATTE